MTEAPGAVTVRDPTLYRVLVVAAWIPGDNDTRAEQRRVLLQRTLAARGLAPPDTGIPSREALAWKDEERWSAHVPAAPPAPGGWRRHSYGRSYHELLAILTGVEQQGRHAQGAAWDAAARAELDAGGAWAAGSPRVELDRVAEGPDPASALGEAWLWTGEWEAAPAGGWSGFGERRYGADACAVWPWGLLGHVPAGEGALGRFDLHTTEDEASRRERDRFLFQDLLVLVAERLKATEFHWGAYRRLMGPHLDDAERRIRSASEALPASASVTQVGHLSTLLFTLCHREAELEDAARAVSIARDAIVARLRGTRGGLGRTLAREVGRHARQMRSDLGYYRTSERRARAALEAVRTLAEVRENQIQTWRGHLDQWHGRFQEQLTNWLAAFGLAVGVGQLLPQRVFPMMWSALEPPDEPFLARLGVCALLGVVGYLGSRTLQRIRGRRAPPPPPD